MLAAWQQLATQRHQSLAVVVKDARGKIAYRYEPLKSPLVRSRFPAVEELLARRDR